MFAFADVMHLLTYEFTRLSAGGLAFTRVVARTLDGFSFRYKTSFVERVVSSAAQRASAIAFTREKHFL